jgi:hypothetical protein
MPQVSIEFAGLVVAVVPPSKDRVDVLLLDARAVGGPPHSAVMLVKDVPGLMGSPDFTITRPASHAAGKKDTQEYAGWIIRGDLHFSGNLPAFSPPDLSKTMDLKKVGDATALVPVNLRPVSATIKLTNGLLKSSGRAELFDFPYIDGHQEKRVYEKCNEVELTDRLTCDLGDLTTPIRVSFRGTDGAQTIVTIPASDELDEPIIISNLVAGSTQAGQHFDAYYTLANNKRTPRIKRYKRKCEDIAWDFPDNPDECRAAKFEE